ncbi:uncharacterized protein LOC133737784 [Rosa rugosa]|uniref:uncharacterized protein LOC133737784 n=1 Tax=Rosa rugosa TaxID=74645 RepID=UPI002B40ED13|nr:uncharacterized protein LOC133737784 [Rosa rugosa]
MAPNWSYDLPEELIISVAKRLTDSLQDFIFFGAVCKSWRSAATEVKEKNPNNIALRLLTHQVPLLLLPLSCWQRPPPILVSNPVPKIIRPPPKEKSEGLNEAVEFYSLKGKGNKISYKLNLPKARMRICFSSFGWLVIVSKTEGCEWSLVHPLNHAKIELPDVQRSLPRSVVSGFRVGKFALSSSPSWTSDYIVMFQSGHRFGFCRPGLGEKWKYKVSWGDLVTDLSYYKGQFYFVHLSSRISVFDIDKEEIRLVAPEFPKEQLLGPNVLIKEHYLVESAGVLLVVLFTTTTTKCKDQGLTFGCRVFEVPFTNSKSWSDSEVRSLGNRTIFLSKCSSSFSIEASDYSGLCKANSIYFMNNKVVLPRQSRDMGVFNMKDGTITRDFDKFFDYEELRGFHSWIQPSL